LNKQYYSRKTNDDFNSRGIHIFEEDWDKLVILDACRYDIFEQYHSFDGRLGSRISRASTTKEFIRANFSGESRLDLSYVSANGWYGKLHNDIDSEVYDFVFCERKAYNGSVPHPETVTDRAIDYVEDDDFQKRLIVHYLQPHEPYFDEVGNELFSLESMNPVTLRQIGRTREQITDAYIQNFKLVSKHVERLLAHLEGKTVITADHGELLGERMSPVPSRWYGHPESVYVEPLIRVPWLVIDSDDRRPITAAEEPLEWHYSDPNWSPDDIQQQLEDLGYL
jgi:hypothetical protein